jgi:hypothetical protein
MLAPTKLLRRPPLYLLAVALALALSPCLAAASAPTQYVDGISDQSLPTWDSSFASSSFASFFRSVWVGQITLARYVLQWNAMSEASTTASPNGDYRERFEAWLQDVRSLGLTPVVALTSYTNVYPSSEGEYQQALEALLDDAAGEHDPLGYVEAWNEPNDQGAQAAAKAGEIANWANASCERRNCQVIAGDFQDSPSALDYELQYIRALTFTPSIWGLHPYRAVNTHRDTALLQMVHALPAHGAGAQLWFTEVGAYYCAHGRVLGEAAQASDASYLLDVLIPALAPAHIFYYGFMAGESAEVPCVGASGYDSELYRASHQPRGAAGVILAANAYPPLILSSPPGEQLSALTGAAR